MSDLVDIIEVAKSGRAKCKSTGEKIPKGELRFGEAFVNTFSSSGSISYRWHFLEAAAKKFPLKVKKALENFDGEVPNREAIDKIIEEAGAKKAKKDAKKPGGYPYADRAPTSRASCIVSGDKIEKGTIRIAIEREIDTGSFVRKGPGYMMPSSVAKYCEDEGLKADDFIAQVKANSKVVTAEELDEALAG